MTRRATRGGAAICHADWCSGCSPPTRSSIDSRAAYQPDSVGSSETIATKRSRPSGHISHTVAGPVSIGSGRPVDRSTVTSRRRRRSFVHTSGPAPARAALRPAPDGGVGDQRGGDQGEATLVDPLQVVDAPPVARRHCRPRRPVGRHDVDLVALGSGGDERQLSTARRPAWGVLGVFADGPPGGGAGWRDDPNPRPDGGIVGGDVGDVATRRQLRAAGRDRRDQRLPAVEGDRRVR